MAIPFTPLIALVVIKCLFISNTTGPIIMDEVVYKMNASSIFRGDPFETTWFPPLYSLLLSPALLSKEHWYGSMLFINVVVSSGVIIPVWWIGSRLLPRSLALAAVVITCLWSFHVTFPRMLMSENLYMPLFLL